MLLSYYGTQKNIVRDQLGGEGLAARLGMCLHLSCPQAGMLTRPISIIDGNSI